MWKRTLSRLRPTKHLLRGTHFRPYELKIKTGASAVGNIIGEMAVLFETFVEVCVVLGELWSLI